MDFWNIDIKSETRRSSIIPPRETYCENGEREKMHVRGALVSKDGAVSCVDSLDQKNPKN